LWWKGQSCRQLLLQDQIKQCTPDKPSKHCWHHKIKINIDKEASLVTQSPCIPRSCRSLEKPRLSSSAAARQRQKGCRSLSVSKLVRLWTNRDNTPQLCLPNTDRVLPILASEHFSGHLPAVPSSFYQPHFDHHPSWTKLNRLRG
jgi:hypothetical protein